MTAVSNCVGDGSGANDKEVISVLLTAGAAINAQDEVSRLFKITSLHAANH